MAGGQHPTGRWRPMTPRANCLTCCRISFAAPHLWGEFLSGRIYTYEVLNHPSCLLFQRRPACQVASRCHLWRPASVHRVSHPSQCMIVLIILVRFIKKVCVTNKGVCYHTPRPSMSIPRPHSNTPHIVPPSITQRIHGTPHRAIVSQIMQTSPEARRRTPAPYPPDAQQAWQPKAETYIY